MSDRRWFSRASMLLIFFLTSLFLTDTALAREAGSDAGTIYVIPFEDVVDPSSAASFLRRLNEALSGQGAARPRAVVIDLWTDGGRLDSAKEIGDAIHRIGLGADFGEEAIPTFCFVRRGFSAGTYFALASGEILMKKDAVWGACVPIMPGGWPPIEAEARAKVEADVHHDLASYISARPDYPRGYPRNAIRSLVSIHTELYLVETELGEKFVWTADDRERFADEYYGLTEEKLVSEGEPLLLDHEKATKLNFVQTDAFPSLDEALVYVREAIDHPDAKIHVISPTAIDVVVGILNMYWVRILLLAIGLGALVIEFKVPGFGAPGITGIVCLGLYFGSSYMAGIADWMSILFFVLGIVLLLIEFFLIPGFGVVGVLGLVSTGVGVFLALQGGIPDFGNPLAMSQVFYNVLTVMLAIAGAALIGWAAMRLLPKTPYANKIVHTSTEETGAGYLAVRDEDLVGKLGVAETTLHPVGKIRLDQRVLDAESNGVIIEAGAPIEVIRSSGMSLVVKAATTKGVVDGN